ncbi:MAG: ligase-associated DNA damage response endonuclease PdeM [Planctomycetota bacterium]
MRTQLASQPVELLTDRALMWERTLFVSDPHFGKDATFRAAAIPVPSATTTSDIDRLGALVERARCERLVILGYFFHARTSRYESTLRALERLFERGPGASVERLLVRGNHDRHAGDPPNAWGFSVVEDGASLGPFMLRHAPPEQADADGSYTLCGHIHPAIVLRGGGTERLRAPALWARPDHAVLPAFGSFCGMAKISPTPGDRAFAFGPDGVADVTRVCVPRSRSVELAGE